MRYSLLADLLDDDLSEVTYDARLAGLGYGVTNHRGGLVVSVSGYNDKLGTLLDTVVERLVNLEVKPDRLSVIAEQVREPLYLLTSYRQRYSFKENMRISTSANLPFCPSTLSLAF